jgi:hypothetical protein
MTSVSSGTDAGDADMTTSLSRIFDFYVIYKLHADDAEVDPPDADVATGFTPGRIARTDRQD